MRSMVPALKLFLASVATMGLATLVSCLSAFVPVFIDGSSEQTVGVIYWRGIPLPFLVSASGFGWAELKPTFFVLDVLVWTIALLVARRKIFRRTSSIPIAADAEVFHPSPATLSDGSVCEHGGETSNYCTHCWTPLKRGVGL